MASNNIETGAKVNNPAKYAGLLTFKQQKFEIH